MALVAVCSKCGMNKVICCNSYCCDCLDTNDDINHHPNCRVAIGRRIEKKKRTADLHKMLEKLERDVDQIASNVLSLRHALREIDPCIACSGSKRSSCQVCNGTGYNPKPNKEVLDERIPPATY